jgi:hypothetical protein
MVLWEDRCDCWGGMCFCQLPANGRRSNIVHLHRPDIGFCGSGACDFYFFFLVAAAAALLSSTSGEEAFLILHVCPHHQAGSERKFMRIYDAELHARPEMAAAPTPLTLLFSEPKKNPGTEM